VDYYSNYLIHGVRSTMVLFNDKLFILFPYCIS